MTHTQHLDVDSLLAQEPFVRALARTLLHGQADDLAQETWLRALTRGATRIADPRHWLARIARNAAHNLRRAEAHRAQRERAVARPELVPSSLELMQHEERRRALVLAVDRLPPDLRAVVLLRWFSGLPPRAIATELGLPVATVWDRLHRALTRLRAQLDAEHGGDRKAWLLPLMMPAAQACRMGLWMGVLLMTTKVKTLLAAACLLLAGVALWAVSGGPGVTWSAGPVAISQSAGVQAEPATDESRPATRLAATREAVASAPAANALATLVVHAVYADDGTPASGVTLVTYRSGEDQWIGPRRMKTDAKGFARFEELRPGRVRVRTDVGVVAKSVTLLAGQVTELEFSWLAGIDLRGIVVDIAGVPVPAAEVWYAPVANSEQEATHVATTREDGRFALRNASPFAYVGARAAGHAPSPMQFCEQKSGTREVRIVLPGPGGDVEGVVLGPHSQPVADALVRIGNGPLLSILGRTDGIEALPAQVRTDEHGRFRALGLAEGEHPVAVRAAGLAPWSGTCRVVEGVPVSLQVTLERGAMVAGIVRSEDGSTVAGARLAVGEPGTLASYRTLSTADGRFRLEGLPCGDLLVAAAHEDHGRATVRLRGMSGETLPCEVRLGLGLVLRGRLLTEDRQPVANGIINASAESRGGEDRWQGGAYTDAEGGFRVTGCPDGRLLRVMAEGAGIVTLYQYRVDPRNGEIVLHARATPTPSARILGTLLWPDGKPAAGLMIRAGRFGSVQSDANGRVEIGPLAPGTVRVQVDAKDLALFQRERLLAAHETWDLGTVRLLAGGKVHVRLSGAAPGTYLYIHDPDGTRISGIDGVTHRSRPLEPGRYILRVGGPGTAAAMVPVEVRDQEETDAEVKCQAGVAARFAFTTRGAWPNVRGVSVHIAGSAGPVFDGYAAIDDQERCALACRLLPGTYTVTATAGDRAGRAEFTVVDGANPTLTVDLR